MTRDATKEVVIRLPVELHAAAVEAAKADDRSLSSLVRVAVRLYIGKAAE